jgi:hypothetical protein
LDQRFHQNQKEKKEVRIGTEGSFRNQEPENTSLESRELA